MWGSLTIRSAPTAFRLTSCLTPGPPTSRNPDSQSYFQVTDLHYKDPYVQEWNLTIERDLGANFGLRVSYDGNHSSDLGTSMNINQPPPNTIGFGNLTSIEFPVSPVCRRSTTTPIMASATIMR